jgi:hypothetical protein
MAKKVDLQAKAKRQKIFAAVGGVILLGVLAFQVPRTMKLLHQSNAAASSSTSSPSAATTPIVNPTLGGGSAAPGAPTTADGLTDPNGAVSSQAGQLLAFSRFRSKDPFAQQLNVNCGESEAGCGSTKGSRSQGGSPGGSTGATGQTGTALPPAGKGTAAVIAVNGSSETVQLGARFPASSPTFVLVSLTATTAKVGIADGSLEGSKQTVTLRKNVPVTLMNTADGTRYVLRLLSIG